jgi:Flp pilus assembly protein TadD
MKFTSLQSAAIRRRLAMLSFALLGLGIAAFWVLITPDNAITQYFSAPISVRDAKIIVGPYPREADFGLLKRNGVTTIVSLLDPKLPFERVLLDRERALAAEYGMTLLDYPMGSLFNHHIGGDYEAQAKLAAKAVANASGRVYLHCYLGMHRVGAVESLIARTGQTTGVYLASHGMRSADANMLDQAQNAYDSGDYPQTLRLLLNVVEKSEASQILAGWSDYHLNDIHVARSDFIAALKLNPQSVGAQTGLGYCALRQGHLDEAATHFAAVLDQTPRDPSALTGMGLTRYRQGKPTEAARLLRASLSIDPKDSDARTALARIN